MKGKNGGSVPLCNDNHFSLSTVTLSGTQSFKGFMLKAVWEDSTITQDPPGSFDTPVNSEYTCNVSTLLFNICGGLQVQHSQF